MVGATHLTALSSTVVGDKKAESINSNNIAKELSLIRAGENPISLSYCEHCKAKTAWDKPILYKLSNILICVSIVSAVFALALFFSGDASLSTTITAVIFTALTAICALAPIGIKKHVNSLYKNYSPEYEIIADTDPERLYQTISNKFSEEEMNNIYSLKYTLLK